MKLSVYKIMVFLSVVFLWSCADDEPSYSLNNKQWTEKVVAVVLPMEKGLDVHWNCLQPTLSVHSKTTKQV